MTDGSHQRRCWACGNVEEHKDSITPWVLCGKCGSQDTRRLNRPAAISEVTGGMMNVTYEAYGIFAKRHNGDVPAIAKLMGDRVFHDLASARIEASVMEMETETPMDVRRLSITVMGIVDPNRPPEVDSA